MSLSERPFLHDIMGGSLKISFRNGWCCMVGAALGTNTSLGFLLVLELLGEDVNDHPSGLFYFLTDLSPAKI